MSVIREVDTSNPELGLDSFSRDGTAIEISEQI